MHTRATYSQERKTQVANLPTNEGYTLANRNIFLLNLLNLALPPRVGLKQGKTMR
jgi:hypothetical protein